MLDHLLKAIRSAAVHNPEAQVAPACVIWPDKERQWEAVISRLQIEMPELLALGDYAPDSVLALLSGFGASLQARCMSALSPKIKRQFFICLVLAVKICERWKAARIT